MTRDVVTTLTRTLGAGDTVGRGSLGDYRRLAVAAGEPHLRRLDLVPDAPAASHRRSIAHLVHLTDTQLADVQSPARIEFLDRHADRRALASLLPAYRPHEPFQAHALEATIRTLRAVPASVITGAPVALAISTGDAIDNEQWNELRWYLSLMQGGRVSTASGGPAFEGVQSVAWADKHYWHPDGYADVYAERWGFPAYPGALEEALRAFDASGLAMPWLACFGNHEGLVQGTSLPTDAVRSLATGDRKPVRPPERFDVELHVDRFVTDPEAYLNGPSRAVTPDPERALFTRREFVEAHLAAGGSPLGHGFTSLNLAEGTTYYAYDELPGVRFVVLDTTNPGGHYEGSIGTRQAAWLEQRLAEVHATYLDPRGDVVRTGNPDRVVVVCSHHGLETLTNDLAHANPLEPGGEDLPRVLAPGVRELLHRFPNVVLWLSGHTHEHHAIARPDPSGRTGGFWELSTGAIADWPVQSRLVELVDNGDGTLSIFGTLVDHAASPDPSDEDSRWRLAAIHREVAANDPHRGFDSIAAGEPADRNVELVVRWSGGSVGASARPAGG